MLRKAFPSLAQKRRTSGNEKDEASAIRRRGRTAIIHLAIKLNVTDGKTFDGQPQDITKSGRGQPAS